LKSLYQGQEEEHAVAILKQACNQQLQYFMAGFATSVILEFLLLK
jgi:hypothetical protein